MSTFPNRVGNPNRISWKKREADLIESEEYSDVFELEPPNMDNSSDLGDKFELKEIKIQQSNGINGHQNNRENISKKKSRMKRVFSTKNVKKRRLVGKHGGLKVVASHVPQKHGMYISDLFTTMIDSKWRWICCIYITMYSGSWLIFGLLWWLITYFRGDNFCVDNVDSFTSAFLFSLETQTTIGYGGRQITPKCPEAVLLLNAQSLIGFIIGAFMLGLIFAKLSRPRNRAETILFSRYAVVALRDGKMCLMFRVGDVRKSQILEAHVRVNLFRKRKTREGLELPFYQQNLPVGIDWTCEENQVDSILFLILPLTIVHVIDENSPLYEMHPKDLLNCDFEIVVVLEGTVEATSMLVQAKTSYIADEILWGHEFINTTDESKWRYGRYRVDFSVFDDTRVVPETPQVSAKDYYEGKMFKSMSESSLLTVDTQEDVDDEFDLPVSESEKVTRGNTFVVGFDEDTGTVEYV